MKRPERKKFKAPKEDRLGLNQVKHVILVSSGKGGVGKSTTASNLASALLSKGYKVGVLDADIYGPSQNMMLGVDNNTGVVVSAENPMFTMPYHSPHGFKVVSIASRVDTQQALNWRGPMVSMVLHQLIFQTQWGELDYLVIDMPPGTGDIQIAICEKIKDARAVIVTTPQDVALIDCKKGIEIYKSNGIEIVGIVENMSAYVCKKCGDIEYIFGTEGGDKLATQYDTVVLGRVPIVTKIREDADNGSPIVLADPTSKVSEVYLQIADSVIERMPKKEEEEEDDEESDGETDSR
jgi:ATP-binding protein involved in chromosome partitioning